MLRVPHGGCRLSDDGHPTRRFVRPSGTRRGADIDSGGLRPPATCIGPYGPGSSGAKRAGRESTQSIGPASNVVRYEQVSEQGPGGPDECSRGPMAWSLHTSQVIRHIPHRNRRTPNKECRISKGQRRVVARKSHKKPPATAHGGSLYLLTYPSMVDVRLRCFSCIFATFRGHPPAWSFNIRNSLFNILRFACQIPHHDKPPSKLCVTTRPLAHG